MKYIIIAMALINFMVFGATYLYVRRPLFGNGSHTMWVNGEPVVSGQNLDFEVTNRFWNHISIVKELKAREADE